MYIILPSSMYKKVVWTDVSSIQRLSQTQSESETLIVHTFFIISLQIYNNDITLTCNNRSLLERIVTCNNSYNL